MLEFFIYSPIHVPVRRLIRQILSERGLFRRHRIFYPVVKYGVFVLQGVPRKAGRAAILFCRRESDRQRKNFIIQSIVMITNFVALCILAF